MSHPALLLIDLQRDFFDEKSGVGHIEKAIGIPATRLILAHARKSGWPVFHVVTLHDGEESLPYRLKNCGTTPYCVKDTSGSEIVSGLKEGADTLIAKQSYSGFNNTDLAKHLDGISTVVLAGVAADCCVFLTAHDAMLEAKQVYVPYQAIGASGPYEYAVGLQAISKSFGSVIDAVELLASGEPPSGYVTPKNITRDFLSSWYQQRVGLVHQVPALKTSPVDDAIQALEGILANTSL